MNLTCATPGPQARRRAKSLSRNEALRETQRRTDDRNANLLALEHAKTREREHSELEALTQAFRTKLARAHVDKARAAASNYRHALAIWKGQLEANRDGDTHEDFDVPTVEVLQSCENRVTWHERRATGQRERFDRVRSCGVRFVHAKCLSCGNETKPIPEGCGVRRICDRCDTAGAIQRRARFGRARGRVVIEGMRYGLTRKLRVGGRYTEKMLTLTVPHLTRAECIPTTKDGRDVATLAVDDTHARVLALWLAWPRFLRKVNRHWNMRWEDHVRYHRAFEWTPGVDKIGHPHFHVFLWSPFVDRELLREWWAESLREVGVRVPRTHEGRSKVIIDLRMLRSFGLDAVRELIKGGRRQALTLSRIEFRDHGAAADAFVYADGWTIGDVMAFSSPEVIARLYMALEAKRLTQASRGFFADDEPPTCTCCHGRSWRVWIDVAPTSQANDAPCTYLERGPPCQADALTLTSTSTC